MLKSVNFMLVYFTTIKKIYFKRNRTKKDPYDKCSYMLW